MRSSKTKKTSVSLQKKRDVPKEKTYVSKEIDTSITILESPENSVVVESLLFLSKYADLNIENTVHLQKCGIMPKLLRLLEKPIPIIRLSLRLISILLQTNEAVYELDNEKYDDILLNINDTFINNPDAPTKEFCAGILAKMAKSTRIALLIFKSDLYSPIFQLIKTSTNANLLANVLELLYNLLDSPTAISLLSIDKAFDPQILLGRMREFDPNMTPWILEIFKRLTYANIDQIMKLLRQCQMVENLFRVITDPLQRTDYFPITFEIITNCLQNPITQSYFIESLEFLEFCKWSRQCPGTYLLPCAIIFGNITNIPEIKQLLFDLSVEDSVLYLLRSKDKKVLSTAIRAISNLTSHSYCCEKILTPIVMREILRLMELDDNSPTNFNEIAVEALYNFCKRNSRTIILLETLNGISAIMKYFHASLKVVPPKTYKQILEIIVLIIATPSGQQIILTKEFFSTLIQCFQYNHEETNLLCLEIMSNCINQKAFRDEFISSGGTKIIVNLLKCTQSKALFKNTLIFIHNILVYKRLAELFLQENLVLVLKNMPKEIRDEVPLISRVLNVIYSLFLPLKFFEFGKLNVSETFKNRFYLINLPWDHPFPCLELLEKQYMSTSKSIYLVDYGTFIESEASDDVSAKTTKKSGSAKRSVKTAKPFNTTDPYLISYVNHLKKYITKDYLDVADQVKIVAIFVDSQMCGPKEEYDMEARKTKSFGLHLESLKKKLRSNIIPIGFIRIGFHCERSLLFKALCDKMCIPCSLIRSNENHGIYWNEVPLIRPGRNGGSLQYYVVDLMDHIGDLYPVGSRDANCYCRIN